MKRIILFFIAFNCISVSSFSQVDPYMSNNLAKYWFYRWRLRNDFMVMGEGPGKSLVAEQRNPERQSGFIKWADGTIMHGYYLSMLAIEHNILKSSGRYEDLNNNNKELYYALEAFERIDYWTETIYSKDNSAQNGVGYRYEDATLHGDVNGFFFRDDVPPDFFSNDPTTSTPTQFYDNYYSMNNEKTGITYHHNGQTTIYPWRIEGDYENHYYQDRPPGVVSNDCYYCPPNLNMAPYLPIVNHHAGRQDKNYGLGEESQDQMIRLILGFFTIVRSCENEDVFIDLNSDGTADVSMNFVKEAKRHATNIIGRAVGYMSGTINVNYNTNVHALLPTLQAGALSSWQILSPRNLMVDFGSISLYAPPIKKVSQELFTTHNDLGILNSLYAKHTMLYPNVFEAMWYAGVGGYNGDNNSHMAFLLNVLSDSGKKKHGSVAYWLYEKSHGKDKNHLYMPFYEYLWGWEPKDNDKDAKTSTYEIANIWLDLAPCAGPHNFGNSNVLGDFSPDQFPGGCPTFWHTPFVYDAESPEFNACNNTTGWFSGVDFMLLYNTVYANNETSKPLYHDLINRIIDYPINTNNMPLMGYYSGEHMLIGAYENMKIRNVISGNAQVEVKALDFIQMEPGSSIDPELNGSIFIYPDKITCNSTTGIILKSDTCSNCNMGNNIGVNASPIIKGKTLSIRHYDYMDFDENENYNNEKDGFFDQEKSFVLFPNPAENEFQILGNEEIKGISIEDCTGKLLKSLAGENRINISDLSTGWYLIIILKMDNTQEVYKLIKN